MVVREIAYKRLKGVDRADLSLVTYEFTNGLLGVWRSRRNFHFIDYKEIFGCITFILTYQWVSFL